MILRNKKVKISENIRQEVLSRDNHQCIECKGKERLEIHHVFPEKFGGITEPSNLITICKECHSSKHIEYQAKYYDMFIFKFKNFLRKVLGKPLSKNIKPLLFLLTKQDKFRPYQQEVIEDILNGKDVLFVSPTGSGKSICFQIPGIMLKNASLVITPLKALMKDQVEGLWKRKVPATYINSDLDNVEKQKRLSLIAKNLFQFVYVAPEQLYLKDSDGQLKNNHPLFECKYDLFVIDEAHCIDKWGRQFRPTYAKLGKVREYLENPRTIALTASASKKVQQNIVESLGMINPSIYVTGFYRPEIELSVITFTGSKENIMNYKISCIYNSIINNAGKKIIIFVPTIKIGKYVWKELVNKDIRTDFYYGKLNIDDKTRIQNEYTGVIKSDLKVLICTSAFGMGINIPDIRLAIHWSIPENIEDYYQQMGRAGRDSKASKAILLYGNGDEGLIRYINEKNSKKISEEEKIKIRYVVEEELRIMINYVNSADKWQYILDYFGEKKNINQNTPNYSVLIIVAFILIILKIISTKLFWITAIIGLIVYFLRKHLS